MNKDCSYNDFLEDVDPKKRFHTQGGGLVEWDTLQKRYVFVEAPAGFEVGDFMPEEWGIA